MGKPKNNKKKTKEESPLLKDKMVKSHYDRYTVKTSALIRNRVTNQ